MNLYRSKTPNGLVWSGTQADARELHGGKDFEHIDVPTDKAGLMAFLNDMEKRVAGSSAVVEVFDEPEPDYDEEAPVRTVARPVAAIDPATCPACLRSERVAKTVATSQAVTSIMADLEDVHDKAALRKIANTAQNLAADMGFEEAA